MKIEKGKTSNGYAITWLFIKITPLGKCGRYFFMVITKSSNRIINIIMYSNSISSHLLSKIRGGDSITAQLLHCLDLTFNYRISPMKLLYVRILQFSILFAKM